MAFVRAVQSSSSYDKSKKNFSNCVKSGGGGSDPGCCLKGDLFAFYNKNTHTCCNNGDVAPANQC